MTTAFMFPGQGAQEVGMGADLCEQYPAARAIYDEADEVLGFKISELCFSGPAERLNATDIQQPAIFVTSVAAFEAARAAEVLDGMGPAYTAGLSLGEYTAYYAAGTLRFDAALTLVQGRARFMQEAAEGADSAMVAVVGLADAKALEVCDGARGDDVLVAANFNCPGQVVLSGHRGACERAVRLAEDSGAIKVVMLDVAGAFHSPLMQSAADKLKPILDATEFRPPKIPVVANVDCVIHGDPDAIRENLYKQVTSPTFWAKSMQKLLDLGVDQFVELGPKKTLCGFMRRINRRAGTMNISRVRDLAQRSAANRG